MAGWLRSRGRPSRLSVVAVKQTTQVIKVCRLLDLIDLFTLLTTEKLQMLFLRALETPEPQTHATVQNGNN